MSSRLIFSGQMKLPVHLKMPSLSPTMSEGSIVSWLKKEGDEVLAGDVLCEVQTDKAVMSLESDEDGVLAKILVPAGSLSINVGSEIAILANPDENWQEVAASAKSPPEETKSDTLSTQIEEKSKIRELQPSRSMSMGPAVRLLLQSYDLDESKIPSTGPHGQLLKGDVLAYVANNQTKPAATAEEKPVQNITFTQSISQGAGFTDIPLSNMRKVIAQRLSESKSTIPHGYVRAIARVDRLNLLRREIKMDWGIKFSINDFIIKACALGLRLVPDLNAIYDSQTECPIYLRSVDICMAVATSTGLITPILNSVDTLSVSDISKLSRQLAKKARDGKLQPHEFQGGSFTISNLGMYDIREFTAVLNLPQVAILAVGTGLPEARVSSLHPDNEVDFSTNITLTLSIDSRCVSEVIAGSFLRYVSRLLSDHPHCCLMVILFLDYWCIIMLRYH
ncbi:unnamed protein product [Heterobilharzia americana]|nr:unnamed protein product [Heterobilharzia americana]